MKKIHILLVLFALIMTSCVSKKKIVYFQGIDELTSDKQLYETRIQPDDVLFINITANDPKATEKFNLQALNASSSAGGGNILGRERNSYLVDNTGAIYIPNIGRVEVGGKTQKEVIDLITKEVQVYVKDPMVLIRLLNFKITVLGEVRSPGVVGIEGNRVTLPEAIALAGDLTLYGKRKNVLIIREINGVKTSARVDLTDAEIINSPYYYLSQNDVVYVEHNKTKVNSTAIGSNITAGIGIVSFLISTIILLTR